MSASSAFDLVEYALNLTPTPGGDDCDCLEEKVQKAGKLVLHLLEEIEEMQDKKHHRHHRRRHSEEHNHSDEVLDDCDLQEKIIQKAQKIFMRWIEGNLVGKREILIDRL